MASADLPRPSITAIRQAWAKRWPEAMAIWSKFTRLSEPRWLEARPLDGAGRAGESFAMIRLTDQAVFIDIPLLLEYGVESFPVEIMAHEVGHHVYCPGDLSDQARLVARIRRALPTKEHLAPLVANLYTDLLINDRLQRSEGLNMAAVYRQINQRPGGDRLWQLYMRIYEILWSLPRETLAKPVVETGPKAPKFGIKKERNDALEGDALLGARLVRVYARDWLKGADRFTMLCLPYLLESEGEGTLKVFRGWMDAKNPGAGSDLPPAGLIELEDDELDDPVHPINDPLINGSGSQPVEREQKPSTGQVREPFEYGQILRALGMTLDDHEVAVRYYRERALPHLVKFPARILPESTDPLPEGLEPWDIGSPPEAIDWFESIIASPRVIPSQTTVQRHWGTAEGSTPAREPLDLDLYVDCSGSMPNPQEAVSYLTLAGAIVALSALRAGARVQATLWSGAREFITTRGFTRDENAILRILTGYLGGATAFPIHILRDTFQSRPPASRPAHILVISDDGVTTLFDNDEQGNSGWDVARVALEKARGGGTFVLNLWQEIQDNPVLVRAGQQGWQIFRVRGWEDLVEFARRFSRAKYQGE